MAKTISQLTEETTIDNSDVLAFDDQSGGDSNKITFKNLMLSGFVDGWTPVTDSWTYASATTVTVPSDATNTYNEGMLVKFNQTTDGTKYYRITNVASTTLTLAGIGADDLDNESITNIFYSTSAVPQGIDGIQVENISGTSGAWQSFTPALTFGTVGNGTIEGKALQVGKTLFLYCSFTLGSTSSVSTGFGFDISGTYTINSDVFGANQVGTLWMHSHLLDTSTGDRFMSGALVNAVDRIRPGYTDTNGKFSVISGTAPFTFATGDTIGVHGRVELA